MTLSTEQFAPCVLCGHQTADAGHLTEAHIEPAVQQRNGEYYWECPTCGESDGTWFREVGATRGLADHLRHRHGVTPG
ncbi:hypothetical protein DPM19_30610 [Actinomadura craniellae]|uniref:C2H2-type domain-containing protein n=1 Tax=Actinomadura craniellae TaxID=2231787 RepID=A0A365GX22_9ACTN|nr:hypothetical protein [Actinomadura craniellae]RAY11379.1 hypothetical protein DPM19_30610 [Actinomadura craniellae]